MGHASLNTNGKSYIESPAAPLDLKVKFKDGVESCVMFFYGDTCSPH